MPDPRILTIPIPSAAATTHFQIGFSADQSDWTLLKRSGATDLDVSLLSSRKYTLDGVNGTDDANNNPAEASLPPRFYRVRLKSASGYGAWLSPFVVPSPEDFVTGMKRHLRDPSLDGSGPALVTESQYLLALANAVQAFERRHPRRESQTYALTTAYSYDLPDDWSPEFSRVERVEYPVTTPRAFLPPDAVIADDVTGQWRLARFSPGGNDSLVLFFTARHARDGSTIPQAHFESVLQWATGDVAEGLRSHKNQFGDLMTNGEFTIIDPRIKMWGTIAHDWKRQAERLWGNGGTGVRTHMPGYDDHGLIPPEVGL